MPMTSISLPRYNDALGLWEREIFDHDNQSSTMLYASTMEELFDKTRLLIIGDLNITEEDLPNWPSLQPKT